MRRVSRRLRAESRRRDCARPFPRLLRRPATDGAGHCLRATRAAGQHQPRRRARTPDSAARHVEQLPSMGPQHQHRRAHRHGDPHQGRRADAVPRCAAAIPSRSPRRPGVMYRTRNRHPEKSKAMDLRQIDCFLEVARELHFGRASRNLFLAQSSVSESIKSLEREVGGPLFDRTSRRVSLTPLGVSFRLGVDPATAALRKTLEECQHQARGEAAVLRVGFLGGGLYELTLPLMAKVKDVLRGVTIEWVELTLTDQFQAVADGSVDAAFLRLPLGHDDVVAGDSVFVDGRKLIVPVGHRLEHTDLVDPEELAHEALPSVPDDPQARPWTVFHFPRFTPQGHPIRRGPVVRTVRECLAAVESGAAVVVMCSRSQSYYSNPGVRYLNIDLPPVPTAMVRRRSDNRQAILDLENCARSVAGTRVAA